MKNYLNNEPIHRQTRPYPIDRARELAGIDKKDFQFRGLRAKAGTDTAESTGDIYRAQQQLGHANVTMTQKYIRERKGDVIKPTRRK